MYRQSRIRSYFISTAWVTYILLIIGCADNSQKANFLNNFITINSEKTGKTTDAISHYSQVVKKAKATGNKDVIAWSYLSLSESYLSTFSLSDSKKALNNAKSYIDFSVDSKNAIKYHLLSGDFLHLPSEYNSSIIHYKQAESISKKLHIKDNVLFKTYISMASHYQYNDEFDKSLENNYKALVLAEHLKDSTLIVQAKVEIGLFHYYQNENNKAIAVLSKCLSSDEKYMSIDTKARIHSLLGLTYSRLKQFKKAEFHFLQSLDIYTKFNQNGLGESWNNLGILDMDQGKWAKAIPKLKKVLVFMRNEEGGEGINRHKHVIAYNIGRCYLNLNQLDSAQFYSDIVMDHAKKSDNKLILSYACLLNSKVSEKRHDWESANEWLKKHYASENEIFNIEKTAAIKELAVKYEVKKKEQHLLLAKKENKIHSNRFQSMLIIGILLVVLLLISVIAIYYKNVRDKELKIKEHQLLQSRLQIAESELKLKETELLNLTNLIIEKNKTQQALVNEDETLDESTQKSLDNIKLLTNEDWNKFNSKFSEVHPDFITKLRSKQFNFSASDKRYLMLLKLGLDTSEMSNALGISPSSVRTHRYRLNKRISGYFSIEELIGM